MPTEIEPRRSFFREFLHKTSSHRFGCVVATLPFGILLAIGARDPMVLVGISFLAGIVGWIFGGGRAVTDRFSEPPHLDRCDPNLPSPLKSNLVGSISERWDPF